MPTEEKKERNKRLVRLRSNNPDKWTFQALADKFEINRITAWQIYKRDKERYIPGDKS